MATNQSASVHLNQEHIQKLALHLGPAVYTALGLLQAKDHENEKD